jgi:hypothetical protein
MQVRAFSVGVLAALALYACPLKSVADGDSQDPWAIEMENTGPQDHIATNIWLVRFDRTILVQGIPLLTKYHNLDEVAVLSDRDFFQALALARSLKSCSDGSVEPKWGRTSVAIYSNDARLISRCEMQAEAGCQFQKDLSALPDIAASRQKTELLRQLPYTGCKVSERETQGD